MLSLPELVSLKQSLLSHFKQSVASRTLPFRDAESIERKRTWLGQLRAGGIIAGDPVETFSMRTYLYTCYEHVPLFSSLLSMACAEWMPLAERQEWTRRVGKINQVAREPGYLVWFASQFVALETSATASSLLDDCVDVWSRSARRDARFNPIAQFVRESIDLEEMLPFARNPLSEQLEQCAPGWGRAVIERMLAVASERAYRYIVLHMPAERLPEYADLLREAAAAERLAHPEASRVESFRQVQTDLMFMTRKHVRLAKSMSDAQCPVCMEHDKPDSALLVLKCGHAVCDYCLHQMSQMHASCACPLCKQVAVPLYVELPERCSKIARVDLVDSEGTVFGRIDAESPVSTMTSKTFYSAVQHGNIAQYHSNLFRVEFSQKTRHVF